MANVVLTPSEVMAYLKEVEAKGFHGKIILGCYGGKVNSIKLDMSVDLEYIKEHLAVPSQAEDGDE